MNFETTLCQHRRKAISYELIYKRSFSMSNRKGIYYTLMTVLITCALLVNHCTRASQESKSDAVEIQKKWPKWTFVHVTDIHVGSPRSFRFQPAWNDNWETARQQIIEIQPDFILIGGDVTRDGYIHRWELENIKADFDKLPFPYYIIPGNMDVGNKRTDIPGPFLPGNIYETSQGTIVGRDDTTLIVTSELLQQFSSIFGPLWWTFVHKNVRVSGFCDMILGSGLPEEEQLWQWLEAQKDQPRSRYHIWIMHYALFINELKEPNFDIRDPEQYLSWYFGIDEPHRSRLMKIFKATGTTRVITGHIHCRKDHFAEGIAFDLAPSTAMSQWENKWPDGDPTLGFLKYEVSEEGIEKVFVPLREVSLRKGYGPSGHPSPSERDYLKAREKK